MKAPSAFLWLFLVLFSEVSFAGTLYKCSDASGLVQYGSKPINSMTCIVLGSDPPPPTKKEKEEAAKRKAEIKKLRQESFSAERNSGFPCNSERQCKKAFSLTQVYISNNADMKLQTISDTIIETYNPMSSQQIGMKATNTPGRGEAAKIQLYVVCKNDSSVCLKRKIGILNEFLPYLRSALRL